MSALGERFVRLVVDAGGKQAAAEALWPQLETHYGEPHRAYHNLDHLAQCFAEWDELRPKLHDPLSVAYAIFFHDVIYAPLSAKNEARSAAMAAAMAPMLGLPPALAAKAERFILATKSHTGLTDGDGLTFLDIDLSILGQPPEAFARYQQAIRREYKVLPEWFYNRKRKAFLKSMVERPRIFSTDALHAKYEATAKSNLAEALRAMSLPQASVAVRFDEKEVWTTEQGRMREACAWNELERIIVTTTDAGPLSCDVFYVLFGGGRGVVVPAECDGVKAFTDHLLALPGFDHEAFIKAMGSTDNANFLVWQRN